MSKPLSNKFEEILYAIWIDYAAKTLNSSEIAPVFKSKSTDERRAIKQAILKRLRETVKEVDKKLLEKNLQDPKTLVAHKDAVRKIVNEVIGENNENRPKTR